MKLSRQLEKAGIGSVRFDFSGSGESDGLFEDMTVSREISEARRIYEFMSGLECADPGSLFLVGFSNGGLIASVLAPELEGVKALVFGLLLGIWPILGERSVCFTDEAGRMDIGGLLLNPRFVDDVKSIDIYGRAAKYKGEVLIVHGTRDQVVPLEGSYRYRDIYKERLKLVEVEGASHLFDRVSWKDKLIGTTVEFLVEHK